MQFPYIYIYNTHIAYGYTILLRGILSFFCPITLSTGEILWGMLIPPEPIISVFISIIS